MKGDTLYFGIAAPDLRGRLKGNKESEVVTYPVSYSYNGGTVIDHKWYAGFKVAKPLIDSDCELVDMAIGLQLNAHPPYATMCLRRKKKLT
jgi:hypothetical protein